MNDSISIVTTFSDTGYYDYGKIFLDSCKEYLHPSIEVLVYKDNVTIADPRNFTILNLEESIPDLTTFKKRNSFRNESDIKFQYQSVRFSHKVYAIYHASKTISSRYLIWLDADTEFYSITNPDFFKKMLPKDYFVGYLGRHSNFSECGFLIFDLTNPIANQFFDRFKWYYDSDEIYKLDEWHDSFVFDIVRKEFELTENKVFYNLSPNHIVKHHFNAVLDGYIMHLKGERKEKRSKMMEKALRRKGELAKTRPRW